MRPYLSRALLPLLLLLPACGPTFSRASEDPEIDAPALSTRLDRVDLELALAEWSAGFEESPFVKNLGDRPPSIAILRIANDTSEHIGGALDSLLNSAETRLVQSGRWNVVDNTTLTSDAIIAERLRDLGDDVDDATIAALGKEFGIEYFVNGRVGDTTEKSEDVRRVQYYLFLRVTEVSTKLIRYQASIDITKQVED
jgi:penicillin-binding protein activator